MAANPKPLRKERKATSSEIREHGEKLYPHKGTRKIVREQKVKSQKNRFEKSHPLGKRLAKFAKAEGAGDYGKMIKEKREKETKHSK